MKFDGDSLEPNTSGDFVPEFLEFSIVSEVNENVQGTVYIEPTHVGMLQHYSGTATRVLVQGEWVLIKGSSREIMGQLTHGVLSKSD